MAEQKLKTNFAGKPTEPGTTVGQVVKTEAVGGMGTTNTAYYRWTGKEWVYANDDQVQSYSNEQVNQTRISPLEQASLPAAGSGSLRYPNKDINESGDYVLFKFKEYQPPFGKNSKVPVNETDGFDSKVFDYNQSNQYKTADAKGYPTIIMYMPEDVSTGFKANWGGKAFSNIGAGILKSAGAEGMAKLESLGNEAGNAFNKLIPMAGSAALQKAITKITGDSISNNDIFGSISGAILNPNVELLFDSIDMRNFNLKFKLVPRNSEESTIINKICKTFKMCTLPSKNPGEIFGFENSGTGAGFIKVPNLCQVSFMRGAIEHKALPRYKMCAITSVDVNYTPDGAYATYNDNDNPGQPVAIELSIGFQETKLVFAEEIENDSIR